LSNDESRGAARNNLRAMNVGDKAFFYHSNCKEPGIVGVMEIVKEYSEDSKCLKFQLLIVVKVPLFLRTFVLMSLADIGGARRPGTAYYDPSSTKDKPRWSLVHVKFVKKFAVPITLKELRRMGESGKPLERMQMLRQSRLSVSRVSKDEWDHLCQVADGKAKEAGADHET
jgi:predicted RNA-binding protein with PUA-like domain